MSSPPQLVVLAGPNGAGKSTVAPALLRDALSVTEFVNADTISAGLSAFSPENTAIQAGRIMLQRLDQLAEARVNFAFETTLASRSFAPWISKLKRNGYEFHLVFLWLPSAEFAIERVRERVQMGGHDVPESVIRRRYERGLDNFFNIYQTLATTWRFIDNSPENALRVIAGNDGTSTQIYDNGLWNKLNDIYAR